MLLFVTKKVVKKKTGSAWNFFNLQYQCVEVHISPNSKLMPPFSVVPSFLKIISTLRSGLTKWINKHTFNYNQNPSQLTSRIHALIFPWIHKGFISPESLIFFQNLHIPLWLRKSFKFIALGLLANTFASQKIESVHFYSCPQAKLSQVFIINHRLKEITHSFRTAFSEDLPKQKGGGWGGLGWWGFCSWKNYQN